MGRSGFPFLELMGPTNVITKQNGFEHYWNRTTLIDYRQTGRQKNELSLTSAELNYGLFVPFRLMYTLEDCSSRVL